MNADFYAILGVESSAGPEVIRRAYRAKAKLYHPDLQSTHSETEAAFSSDRMAELTAAYAVLSDPVARAQYDQTHGRGPNPSAEQSAKEVLLQDLDSARVLLQRDARLVNDPVAQRLLAEALATLRRHVSDTRTSTFARHFIEQGRPAADRYLNALSALSMLFATVLVEPRTRSHTIRLFANACNLSRPSRYQLDNIALVHEKNLPPKEWNATVASLFLLIGISLWNDFTADSDAAQIFFEDYVAGLNRLAAGKSGEERRDGDTGGQSTSRTRSSSAWAGAAGTGSIAEKPELLFSGHRGRVNGLTELLNGQLLSWSQDGSIRIWDADTAEQRIVVNTQHGAVLGAVPLPDGRLLTWGGDDTLRLWELSSGALAGELRLGESAVIGSTSLGEGIMVSWLLDGRILTWDLNPHGKLLSYGRNSQPARGAIAALPGELASWHGDASYSIWDPLEGTEIRRVTAPSNGRVGGVFAGSQGQYVAWTRTGSVVVSKCADGHDNTSELRVGTRIHGGVGLGSGRAAFAAANQSIAIVDIDAVMMLRSLQANAGVVNGVSSTATNDLLSWSSDGAVLVWDVTSWRARRRLVGAKNQLRDAFEMRGGRIVARTEGSAFAAWSPVAPRE